LTTARGNRFFEGPRSTNFRVQCPAGCTNYKDAKLWGDSIYKDDSSICLAGIHNGVITDKGGHMIVALEEGRKDY